ncbi:P-loop containing nucleoside triphosphate hydrolase protein [Truncatella angustata]|uniref:RNA helicase n=1 Tax=Truncatella angustata TaxID=152316 RepID=A0A9P8V011_9PEZI|nr:P-loop containing nucleoside triphosphate hydrolase protein [Truncatella angustata]KAH6661116.1 P-loop containing nucleoside triphosphate hydrolase protein [Truncatella angustata]KAH8202451.1 hypothetical protein TruAng_003351 [Truncatella angustata]
MKRKLDVNDAPSEEVVETGKTAAVEPSFAEFNLDPRLLQAIATQKYKTPTPIQQKCIPLALDGKDILAKSRTGSGKTAAYCLPMIQSILKKKAQKSTQATASIILVPTKELVDQVYTVLGDLTTFCSKDVQIVKLDKVADTVSKSLLANSPDILVGTPAQIWHNIKNSSLTVEHLTHLVLDEADLLLSYGYEGDLQSISGLAPKAIQTIVLSATLTPEVDTLKGMFCRDPTVVDLQDEAEDDKLSQFVVKCAEDEKFLLAYVMYKLQLIKGKSIIFVSNVDRCYRLKLFFEQFGIRSCILNSELPVNSRLHVVSEFNRNVYDIIIASDENEVIGDEETPDQDNADANDDDDEVESKKEAAPPKKKKRKSPKDTEYGVSRGIDFRNVSCVVNFDLPTSSRSYTHRIGRTARASQSGMALSFVIPKDQYRKHMPTSVETAENDEKVLAKIVTQQQKKGREVKPYSFDMKQVNNFRYRMNDALRAVTSVAVREARVRELRQELAKSEKLKRYFEEKPQELSHLVRHDTEMRTARTQSHLKQVPDYLLPEGKKAITANDIGFVPFNKDGKKKGKSFKGKGRKVGGRRVDPLKSFRGRPKSRK